MKILHLVRGGSYALLVSGILVVWVFMWKIDAYFGWLDKHRPHDARTETGEVVYLKTPNSVVFVTLAEKNQADQLFLYPFIGALLSTSGAVALKFSKGGFGDAGLR